MVDKLKIETLCAFDLLNHLNIEYGSTDYDYFIERLGQFRTEIEKEFEARDKEYSRIDEGATTRTFVERVQQVQRDCPDIIACTVERKFDNPEKIGDT